ncbi:MAG: polysaccharide biosynthesis C-terminal domain-containing protein [Flavobacteriaceae bacterium]
MKIAELLTDSKKVLLLKLSNLFLKFVSSIILIRYLGIDGKGEYFSYSQIGGVISFLLCLSIGDFFYFNSQKEINRSLFLSFRIVLIGLLLPIILLSFLLEIKIFYFYLSFILSGGLDYLTLSLLKSERRYNTVNLYLLLKSTLLLGCLVFFSLAIERLVILNLVISIALSFLFKVNNFKSFKDRVYDLKYIGKNLIQYTRSVHVNNVFGDMENKIDVLILVLFSTPTEIGLYSIAVVMVQMINHFSNLINQILSPLFNEVSNQIINSLYSTVYYSSIFFTLFIITFQNPLLKLIYNVEDQSLFYVIVILSIAFIPETLSRFLILRYKFGEGSKEYLRKISMITVILNISINLIFIPIYGILGAAITSLITYSIRYILIKRNMRIEGNEAKLLKPTEIYLSIKNQLK